MSTHPLRDWIPYRFQPSDVPATCRWICTAGQRFDAPFFDETLSHCRQHPYNASRFKVVSTIDGLIDLAATVPSLEPTAFIFHVSRCGSTLLSQLLSLREQHIVLSEVPLLDDILRLPEQANPVSIATRDALFRATIQLLGQRRTGHETHLIVKLDSWHIFFYETIRRLYPTVPMILLYRRPDAVVASHGRQPGMQAVPGLLPACWFGLSRADAVMMNRNAYTAHVLDCYLKRFQAIAETDALASLVQYQPDGVALMRQLTQQIGVSLTDEDWLAVQERSSFHAKYPGQAFSEEAVVKAVPTYLSSAMARFTTLMTTPYTINQRI